MRFSHLFFQVRSGVVWGIDFLEIASKSLASIGKCGKRVQLIKRTIWKISIGLFIDQIKCRNISPSLLVLGFWVFSLVFSFQEKDFSIIVYVFKYNYANIGSKFFNEF